MQHKIKEFITQQEQSFLGQMLLSMPGYVFIYNENSQIVYMNQSLNSIVEQTDGKYENVSFEEIFGSENKSAIRQCVNALKHTDSDLLELRFSNEMRHAILQFSVNQQHINGMDLYVGVGHDLSEHRWHSVELEKRVAELGEELKTKTRDLTIANDRARAASRAKSGFLANMSHELRTPLNAVIGYAEILQEDIEELSPDECRNDLEKILISGKHLLSMINDILDLSKIEAGRMGLNLEYFRIDHMIEDVVNTIQHLAKKNDVELTVELNDNYSVMLADLTKVRQILFNLLSNAIKFSDHGEVQLECHVSGSDDSEIVVFEVSDNGIGMTEEQINKLFNEYFQGDSTKSREWGGTGLGLMINQRFCQMMGGHIRVESEFKKGSKFIVSLPTNTAKLRFKDSPDGYIVGPKVDPKLVRFAPNDDYASRRRAISRVLVIDDDPNVRDLMERCLSREGFDVMSVDNGRDGIAAVESFQPDVITLDVLMPVMDGWSVLSELKDKNVTDQIPVIMLSMLDEYDMSYALGAADYLLKPIRRHTLVETVLKHLRDKKQHTILVVDDMEENRFMISRIMRDHGILVIEAENGADGLVKLADNDIDLILLDLVMPEMDGFQFSEKAKAHDEFKDIPIIVITAHDISSKDMKRLNGNVDRIYERDNMSFESMLVEINRMVAHRLRAQENGDDSLPDLEFD
ncbi:MAG: response regulator [Gammaproteobacteria bacterium]|nr:response regulator [Gammaproteobacteria bacterium]MDH5729297.1 response regulator [Gammaproteobacteria bacterium]